MYKYLNIVYKKMVGNIMDLWKNYFWQTWETNLVAGQTEYNLKPVIQSPSQEFGQYKIERVLIKYKDNDEYTRAEQRDWDKLEYSQEWYADNQTFSQPFFVISDQSIFVFPASKFNVANGLQLEGSERPYDLTDTMTQDDILVPSEFHDVIATWMKQYVYQNRNQLNEKNDARNEYQQELNEMLWQLSTRRTSAVLWRNDSLRMFE